MDTTKLNLLLEAIDEINRLEDDGYVLEEGVGETAAVYALSLAALAGIGLLVRKLDKKKAKTNYHKYIQERKKLRVEVKKNLKYTLDEFISYSDPKHVAPDVENNDKVSMKVRQGIGKAITSFNMQVSKCTNQVMKMKLSIDYIEDIYDIVDEYIDPIDRIINSISDTKWVEESNPKNMMSQIVNLYDNLVKLETTCEVISNDWDVAYDATRNIYSQFEDLCCAVKISGIKHQALKQFDYETKNSKEYQKYNKYYKNK